MADIHSSIRTDPVGIKRFFGQNSGPRVGIMAVTHGDEPAGLEALAFLESFFSEFPLLVGELVLIVGNPVAASKGIICVDHNLNRLFASGMVSLEGLSEASVEQMRCNELKSVLASLDYLLDIHSTNNPGPVFSIIKNETPGHWHLACGLPVEFASSGWNEYISGTTCDWVERSGGVGITIECGDHTNPEGGKVAVLASRRFLQMVGIHDFGLEIHPVNARFRVLGKEGVADSTSFNYTKIYRNFEPIKPQELIASDLLREYRAPERNNLAIVFPTKIESIRSGAIREAYLYGEFYSV